MKKFCLAICLLVQLVSFSQIQFDSCYVYKDVEKKDIKPTELLYEFFQLSGSPFVLEKLSPADAATLTQAINRATNMTFNVAKIPDNPVFLRCHAKGITYGFVLLASQHIMIDAARNIKLVFDNAQDIEFINRLETTYSFKKSSLHGK